MPINTEEGPQVLTVFGQTRDPDGDFFDQSIYTYQCNDITFKYVDSDAIGVYEVKRDDQQSFNDVFGAGMYDVVP